jgi:hypothetical protein
MLLDLLHLPRTQHTFQINTRPAERAHGLSAIKEESPVLLDCYRHFPRSVHQLLRTIGWGSVMSRYFQRKFFASLISGGFITCGLGACAIHPLPENVTGVKTSQIVHRNRCEARDAVRHIEDWLIRNNKRDARLALQKIGIALSYTLDMTEMDSVSAMTNFEELVTKGMFSFNPAASNSLTRQNQRVFTVADNYQTLKQMRDCELQPIGPNYQYPIVGTIGIGETIQTFLTMALHEDLNGVLENPLKPPNDPSEFTAASPIMVETLTFTTVVSASVEPQITLMPVLKSSRASLNTASLDFMWQRNDKHTVIVGIGMPTVATLGDHSKRVYSVLSSPRGFAARARTPLLIDAVVPADTSNANSGVSLALEGINNQIVRFQALRSTVLVGQ